MSLVYLEMIVMIVTAIVAAVSIYFNLVLHQKKYAHHVAFEQPTKLQKKILEHPFICFLCVLLFVTLYSWVLASFLKGNAQQFCFGGLISLFSLSFGNALAGILIFRYTIKHPEKISGQTIFKDKQFLALHQLLPLMPCLALLISLFILHQSAFFLGGLLAVTIMSLGSILRLIKN